ncbi:hypothetical protein ACFL35_02250 [Candidatus Riflebacteria bacterium]
MRSLEIIYFILFLCLGFIGTLEADLYLSAGGNTFNVSVRNESFKNIQQARGRVYVSGNTARITVEANGYREGRTNVYLRPNTKYYRADVRLADPTVFARMKDNTGKYLENAYVNHFSQSMYWADEFGMRATFPKEGFSKLTARDIQVRVNYMHAFGPRIYLRESAEKWSLEVIIKRRDMRSMSNTIEIIVKRDVEEKTPQSIKESIEQVLELITDYKKNQELAGTLKKEEEIEIISFRLESLAKRIRSSFSSMIQEERRIILKSIEGNSTMQRELKTIENFEKITH